MFVCCWVLLIYVTVGLMCVVFCKFVYGVVLCVLVVLCCVDETDLRVVLLCMMFKMMFV